MAEPTPPPSAAAPRRRLRLPRVAVLAVSVAAACGVIVGIEALAPASVQTLLIDIERGTYPLTIQNAMWIVFAVGVGELVVRAADARVERAELGRRYLPEDERTILQAPELRDIYAAARGSAGDGRDGPFLPRLIQRIVLQFQASRSIERANALLNSSLELYLHEIDLRYSMIRYIVWAIPTLGFIGTVVGISLALSFAGGVDVQDPALLSELTKRLAVAFNTTLLALIMSAILLLVQHIVQAEEERALNAAGQYCLDNLINRLYEE